MNRRIANTVQAALRSLHAAGAIRHDERLRYQHDASTWRKPLVMLELRARFAMQEVDELRPDDRRGVARSFGLSDALGLVVFETPGPLRIPGPPPPTAAAATAITESLRQRSDAPHVTVEVDGSYGYRVVSTDRLTGHRRVVTHGRPEGVAAMIAVQALERSRSKTNNH